MNNESYERRRFHAYGVLPMRHPTEYPELRLHDPAARGMTDFMQKSPISVAPDRPIEQALADMMRFGVRALLVLSDQHVVGLVTSYDIEGIRRIKFQQRFPLRRDSIRVGDIMTDWENLPTVAWSTMQSSRIADLLDIFEGVGVMHLLVVESEHLHTAPVVRGLISRARIEGRLNGSESMRYHARTYAGVHHPDQE